VEPRRADGVAHAFDEVRARRPGRDGARTIRFDQGRGARTAEARHRPVAQRRTVMKLHLASLLLSSFLSTMFVGVARADDACTCAADGAATVLETTSRDGRVLKLRFDADPVTTATDAAHLCVDPAAVVTRAKLWMPSMGHGS